MSLLIIGEAHSRMFERSAAALVLWDRIDDLPAPRTGIAHRRWNFGVAPS